MISGDWQATLIEATERHRAGDRDAAERGYREVLAVQPENADALHLLGVLRHQCGDSAEAVSLIERAIARRRGTADFHSNLAEACRALGHLQKAEAHARRATDLDPAHTAAYTNLGAALSALGRMADAGAAFEKALGLAARHAEALAGLGTVRRAEDRLEDAVALYRRAIAADPACWSAWVNLGNALLTLGAFEAGCAHYRKALSLAPRDGLRIKLATALPVISSSREAMVAARERVAEAVAELSRQPLGVGDPLQEVGATSFHLAYQGFNDRDLQVAIARLHERACPDLLFTAEHCRDSRPVGDRRIRVGFASANFSDHAVTWYLRGLLDHLPRDRFEIHLMAAGASSAEAVWAPLRVSAEHLHLLPRELSGARRAIADLALDILVYPDIGMEPLTYFLAFARLAPVQCVTWGHPVTTGIGNLDYFVSADAAEIPEADEHYSERLVRLHGLTSHYYPPPHATARPRGSLGLPEVGRVYLFPHSLFKLHPDFDAVLGGILDADRDGSIVLFEGLYPHWGKLLRERLLQTLGPDMARVRFLPRCDFPRFIDTLAAADVVLDSFPFAGGNTTYQALGAGVPVVSLPSRFLAGRTAFMLYRRMGIDGLIAETPENYVAIAVRTATDPAWREQVRSLIAERRHLIFEDRETIEAWSEFLADAAAGIGRSREVI